MATNIVNTTTGAKGYQVPGSAIPAGWSSTGGGSSPAPAVSSASSSGGSSGVGGAVNASGQLVNSSGQVIGTANPADRYGPGAVQADGTDKPADLSKVAPTSTPASTAYTGNSIVDALNQGGQKSDFASRSALATQNGIAGYTGTADQNTQLLQKYKTGLAAAQTSGQPASTSMGGGMANVQQNLPAGSQEPQSVSNFLTPENPAVQTSTEQLLEWLNPEAERKMLDEHIKQLSTDRAELSSLKTDLMNVKNVMSGTEDDIRKEIQAAGGMGTDSQIRALAIGRNQSLLKQSQLIADQIQSQTDLVNSDVSLIGDEKQMASQQFNQRMSLLNYQQENQKNSFNAFKGNVELIQKTAGWEGVLQAYANNPSQLALVDSLYGGPGSIQKLATMPPSAEDSLDLQIKQANLANIYSQIEDRKNQGGGVATLTGKPQNASQSSANGYADRLNESNLTIDSIGDKFAGTLSQLPMLNFMKTGDRQSFEQAKINFVTAVLRRESGASISPSEFKNEELKYFPQPGDKPQALAQKARARNTAINNLYREANVNRPALPGQIIESNGKRYKVGDDGQTLIAL